LKGVYGTYTEKFNTLSLDKKLPVAVLNLEILASRIGQYQIIGSIPRHQAVRLTRIADPVLAGYFDVDSHIWVSPHYNDYAKAWHEAGFKKTPNSHLDHLHSKAVAKAQGYHRDGYVLLYSCSAGANTSAGHEEKARAENANALFALKNSICYADELHWRKMWGLKKD
jgi:hypothetical protein